MVLEAPPDPLVGATLEGRFRVQQLLGEGGMGRVYIAEELRLKRRCALKVLLPELCADPGCVDRFLREAQAIAQIHHENVVDIYHLGEDTSGVVFFAMELLTGEDLESRLLARAARPLDWQTLCRWTLQVAAAMSSVHAAGLIHRDLKPSNIVISVRRDGREQIKLLDFGIVKSKDGAALTSTGAAIGTPFYMSPEQILAPQLDHRTDVYSLGALLFEALAGRMVFVGEAIQVAMQHCNVPPPRLRQVAPHLDIPDELEELVAHMLAKDPEQRVQSMDAVAEALLDLLPPETASSPARPITARTRGAALSGASPAALARPHSGPSPAPARSGTGTEIAAPSLAAVARTLHATPPGSPLTPASTVELRFDSDRADPGEALRPSIPSRRPVALMLGGAVLLAVVVLLIAAPWQQKHERRGDPPIELAAIPPPTPLPALAPPPSEPPKPPESPATSEPPQPPEPASKPDKPDDPPRKSDKPATRPVDPLKQVQKAAAACRKKNAAVGKPKMTVKYVVDSGGAVTSADSDGSPLGQCFESALKAARFTPGSLRFLKIDL